METQCEIYTLEIGLAKFTLDELYVFFDAQTTKSVADPTAMDFTFTVTTARAFWGGRAHGCEDVALVRLTYNARRFQSSQARAALRDLCEELKTATGNKVIPVDATQRTFLFW